MSVQMKKCFIKCEKNWIWLNLLLEFGVLINKVRSDPLILMVTCHCFENCYDVSVLGYSLIDNGQVEITVLFNRLSKMSVIS